MEITPDLGEVRRFLALLDPDASAFTFQFATDAEPKPRPDHRAGHFNLPLDNLKALAIKNENGCACWVMVNEGNFKGRRAANVLRIRAVFCDLDGAPLQPAMACALEPHLVTESSPNKFHVYWFVTDLPLDKFESVQKAIAARFGGDSSITDLCRVMRVPGLRHAKDAAAPFMTRIVQVNERLPYSPAEVLQEFPPIKPRAAAGTSGNGHDAEPTGDLIKQILSGASYHGPLCMLAFREVADGRAPAKVVITLRSYMESSSGPRDDRWFDRYESIPGLVSSAQEKLERQGGAPHPEGASDDAWPEPDLSVLSDHRLAAPVLPLEVFGPYWSNWISVNAEAKGCAPDYVVAGLLPSVGTLIGNARWGSPWAGWAEPPALWSASIGLPSSGKSPGLDATIEDVLKDMQGEANADLSDRKHAWLAAKMTADIARKEFMEDVAKFRKGKADTTRSPVLSADADIPEEPAPRRILTKDPTIEKVALIMRDNPKGILLARDELAGWLGSLEKYGGSGSDRAFYIEGYGGRSHIVDRVKHSQPIMLEALTVGIVGGIQPDRLATLVLSQDDDGLAARFIYFWPEPVPPQRPARRIDGQARAKFDLLYRLQLSGEGKPIPLAFDNRAAAYLQELRCDVAKMEADASGFFLSWLGKLPGFSVRLATVLEHLWWCGDQPTGPAPTRISERALVAAIAFLTDYAVPMAKRGFGEAAMPQADRDAVTLARWIRAQMPETVNARELRHASALSTKEVDRYDNALAELGEAGWIRPASVRLGGKTGRPRKDWLVNPRLKELLR